jgi:hypothetical protein
LRLVGDYPSRMNPARQPVERIAAASVAALVR